MSDMHARHQYLVEDEVCSRSEVDAKSPVRHIEEDGSDGEWPRSEAPLEAMAAGRDWASTVILAPARCD